MRNGRSGTHDTPIGLAAILTLLALVAGCTYPPVDIGSLPTAVRPGYGLGDAYRFSDGSSHSVVAVDSDVVRWRGKNGSYTTSHDVLMPRLAWANDAEEGSRRISAGIAALFPLELGKAVHFTAMRSVRPAAGDQVVSVQEDWGCNVTGAARVATGAGNFDTWRVDCVTRETPPLNGDAVIQHRFYYAPVIGFYVRTEEWVGKGPVRMAELLSYTSSDPILADSTLRQRSYALQHALEDQESGTTATWTDAATGASGVVALLNARASAQYTRCRDFAERIQYEGRLYALHGTGCREPEKIWDIVAMAPGGA